MATSVVSPPAPVPPQELSLTGVAITFLTDRPKKKIKLTIKLDGKTHAVEIDEGGLVEWSGKILCLEGAKITICAQRRSGLHFWKDLASAEALLTQNPPSVFDTKRKIEVALTVIPSAKNDIRFSDTVTELAAAKAIAEKKIPIVEKLEPILRVLDVLASIGEPIKDIHPAIHYTVGAINALIKLCKVQETCRKAALDLVEQITSFLSIEKYKKKLETREETRRAVQVMLVLISGVANYICEKTRTGLGGIIGDLFGTEYREKIGKFQTDFVRAKESFDRSVQLEILDVVGSIESKILLDKLAACDHAYFTSSAGCLDGTRADLRRRVNNWIDNADPTQPNLFWLFGHAGSGKSTVAHTIAKIAEHPARGFGLSCFFCKRDDSDLSNPRRLLPTLAHSFAQQYESYGAALVKFLRTSRSTGITTTADVETQFTRLFGELLVDTVDPLRPHVIVIDALDECGSSKEQTELATHILALSRAVPWIKVFITSRNELSIDHVFSEVAGCIACPINNETGVDNDIRLYIESQARDLHLFLSGDTLRKLTIQAEGLFIWCRTLFEYLRGALDANSLLDQLFSSDRHSDSPEPWSELYTLYDKILNSALGQREEDISLIRMLLSIVNVAAPNRPLSAKAIMSFLHGQKLHTQYSAETAAKAVKKLHAVLYEDTTASGAVRARHASFYDFLGRKAISGSTESGWMTSDTIHQLMAQGCLKTLHEELRFNICEIETPVLNKDIPDLATRISVHISEELQYSSLHWFIHASSPALATAEVQRAILELLYSKKVLFWFECMSLLGSLERIRFIFRKFMRASTQEHPTIMAAVEDTCRFANSFADTMDSIAHIYLSALWWLPENSLMYQNLGLSKETSWNLIENKPKNWDALVWRCDQGRECSVAFSPDGQFVAYGNEDGAIYIRDSQTGTLEGEPLQGHKSAIYCLAYSPDGCSIMSGSSDNTARIWNARSRKATLEPLKGHSDIVSCVAFSPDGLFVVSGSNDSTIRIWNTQTGESEGEPLLHCYAVTAVVYSPDGRFIASVCDDKYVHLWDTASHKEAVKPFQGHQAFVQSVAYSHDGHTIVSGSGDTTIRIWNAKTGEAIGEPLRGHTNTVYSVTYCPDGCSILSGSDDGTVRLWNAITHTAIGEPLQTHSGEVWSVSYSPDGTLIASASTGSVSVWDTSTSFVAGSQSRDLSVQAHTSAIYAVTYSPNGHFIASGSRHSDQICLWNAQTGAVVDAPVLRHAGMSLEGGIQAIAYSRDGHFLVSGSDDSDNNTVCVLDAQTGDTISGPLRGHSNRICSVAYSPDGSCVASASEDGTVHLWDVQTGAAIGEPLQVRSPAKSVAFSPDGTVLACGTDNRSIWICDVHTRASIRAPIHPHSSCVCSVVFSPDGRCIASGSYDCSVRIWDAQTGKALGGPLQGHHNLVMCVAYSPDGRFIASGSADKTVIIWDVQSGLVCGEPLQGHSDWIRSVAYSPDGCSLASASQDGKIYVHRVSNDHEDGEAHCLSLCSHMDPWDGWIKDGETLLFWVPTPYRNDVQSRASLIIPHPIPNIATYSIDYKTLFRYSGRNWVDIISGFNS